MSSESDCGVVYSIMFNIFSLPMQFGRGVPVIIPADLRKVLAYLSNADVRLASGVLNTNHYLFPNKGKDKSETMTGK